MLQNVLKKIFSKLHLGWKKEKNPLGRLCEIKNKKE